jgi:hypothetical protein
MIAYGEDACTQIDTAADGGHVEDATLGRSGVDVSLLFGPAGITPGFAADSTIPCSSPPDKGASVAVHPGAQVSTTQDNQNGTCIFSINGAVATSPPSEQVIQALNEFRGGSRRYIEPEYATLAVAALMAASAPVDEVPKDLLSALVRAGPKLSGCLAAFFQNDFPVVRFEEQGFSCVGVKPYSDGQKRQILERSEPAVGTPTLVISQTWADGRFRSVVYLPVTMAGMPPLPIPSR